MMQNRFNPPGEGSDSGVEAPCSTGKTPPAIKIPENACDAHHHVYDPARFPYSPEDVRNQPPATVEGYRLLQKRLKLTRNVIVQASSYGFDNACTLDALRQMGKNARAVVVIDEGATDAELNEMNELGVRGVRFNFNTPAGAPQDCSKILNIACRVHALGWHVQFWMSARDTAAMADFLPRLPNPVVFDHRAHLPQPEGIRHPAFSVVCKLIDDGKAWVKLSGLYHGSRRGEPDYADSVEVGRAFVKFAPERMLWGTDWPHPSIFSEKKPWPDDALMLDLLAEQAPDEAVRNKILVENPEKLYGFSA